VEGIEPERVLRFRKHGRISNAVNRVAPAPCAMRHDLVDELFPGRRIELALGHKAQGAFLPVLIDVDGENGPEPARWVEPCTTTADCVDLPARSGEDVVEVRDNRIFT